MSASKRPSTSSLRRYLTSRPYIAVADIRRRFGLEPDAMSVVSRNGTTAYIGLPERESTKLQDLWQRDEVGDDRTYPHGSGASSWIEPGIGS